MLKIKIIFKNLLRLKFTYLIYDVLWSYCTGNKLIKRK